MTVRAFCQGQVPLRSQHLARRTRNTRACAKGVKMNASTVNGQKTASPRDRSGDPLLAFLERHGVSSRQLLFFAFLTCNLPTFLYAWSTQGLFSTAQRIGLLEDYNTLFTSIIGLPFTWFFYL